MKKAFPLTNIIRHTLIVFFMLTILLPLAWVLLLSIKSMPDSMRGNLWPRKFDFNHYAYVFEKITTPSHRTCSTASTLPQQPFC